MGGARVAKSNSEDFRLKAQLDPKTFSSRRLTFKRSIGGYEDFLSTRKDDHEYEYGHEYEDNSYHGVSIPFRWESQPGTPKHNFHSHTNTPLAQPPLTPPPSFFYTPKPRINNKRRLLKPNYDLLRKIFHSSKRASHSRPPSPSSPASSSSSSSSSSSTFSSLRTPTISSSSSSRRMMIYIDEKQKQSRTSTSRCSFESATSSMKMGDIRECHRDRMYGNYFDECEDGDCEVSNVCLGKSPATYFAIFKSAIMIIPNKKKTFNY